MGEWHKTVCSFCAGSCGLDILIEDNRMVEIRGDKDNQITGGYVCRKGLHLNNFQHHDQRLTHPLKKVGDSFERISWDQAFKEIAEKIKAIVGKHGPRSLAYAGEARQYGVPLIGGLGSQNCYSSIAQELTGVFWVGGRTLGVPSTNPDYQQTDVLMLIGCNPYMSANMHKARLFLSRFSKDPDKQLVVIDPRLSETARHANIHLPLRPGTDALLYRAMISIIIQEGWHNKDYIAQHVNGLNEILPWFSDFDARSAIEVCQLDYGQVREVCHMFATRKSSLHSALGIEMGRHSTVTSYLENILLAICGRIGVSGGNIFRGSLTQAGAPPNKAAARDVWRAPATGYLPIMGMLPPAILPEEIMSDSPERHRALIICGSNPVRSWPDTNAFEKAFKHLDLLVTVEIAMSETAALSDYVLPARTCFESWGSILPFPMNNSYPEIAFQIHHPVMKPVGETLDTSEILVRLADSLELIPEIPDSLYKAARDNRMEFGAELMAYVKSDPGLMRSLPFILAKTLGQAMGSNSLAALWWSLFTAPPNSIANMTRGGFTPGPNLTEQVFQAIMDHPEGLWVGRVDPEHNLAAVNTPDKRINLFIPELADWVKSIDAKSEARALESDPEYPLILMAGRHMDYNVNTQMRDPAWNRGHRACTLAMNSQDALALNLTDGQLVKVTTEAGCAKIELEVTDSARSGQVIIPHGFGLNYNGQVYGVNVNYLTKNTHRDRIAGTPISRFVPCRVEGT